MTAQQKFLMELGNFITQHPYTQGRIHNLSGKEINEHITGNDHITEIDIDCFNDDEGNYFGIKVSIELNRD